MGRRLIAWFGLVLIILLANAALSYRALRTLNRDRQQITHTHEVLIELETTLSTIEDAETGQRGYLLTGSEDYLAPYNAARASIGAHLKRLHTLTSSDPHQQRLLSLLESQVQAKLDELNETVELRRQQQTEQALQVVRSNRGKRLMDEIRQTLAAMSGAEDEARQQRINEFMASQRQATLMLLIISVLALAMLLIFYLQVSRGMAERARLLADARAAHIKAESAYQTEQEARTVAERANRLKDEFLATVSHELRTPLTALLGWARMLRTGSLNEATAGRALEAIERNAHSQAQLVEDLLDVSRITSGKLRLDVRQLDLTPIIEAAIDAVRPAADAKQIRLQCVLDPKAGPIAGDSERLQQIMWNLLSNAIKFTPKGGRVQVRLERVNSHVEIIVSDTGQGIAADFLPYVFDRFRQADAAITRTHGGLGLGLTIARHLVESHGGSIKVDSPGVNQGTTFTVQLPLTAVRPAEVALDGNTERVHPAAGRDGVSMNLSELAGVRVLAVDDQSDTLEMIAAILSRAGAEVRTATSAAAALQTLAHWRPDLLIADIGMPGEDGYALISKVRALTPEQGGQVPAIALTAYARVEDRLRTLSAGYQMHVPKPVEPVELTTIVASLARRPGQAVSAE